MDIAWRRELVLAPDLCDRLTVLCLSNLSLSCACLAGIPDIERVAGTTVVARETVSAW